MTSAKYNLFVGSAIGTLKGVAVKKEDGCTNVVAKNLIRDRENISGQNEIKCLSWGGEHQNEILLGSKSMIRTFDVGDQTFSSSVSLPGGETCGIFKSDNKIFVGLSLGSVQSIALSDNGPVEWTEELKINKPIERLKRSTLRNNVVATGGKDHDLKLWDLNVNQMMFNAKNIKPDELQLQVPVWVSDIAFCKQSEIVATCSRHGYVRLYDPLLPQRRPVFNAHQNDQIFTCLSSTPNKDQFLAGSGTGDLFLVDVRGKNSFVGKYKGFTGAVKDVACPPNQPFVFSVSLDRHFRIHDFASRKLILKEYMQTRLTTILPTEPFVIEEIKKEKPDTEESEDAAALSSDGKSIRTVDVKLTDGLFDRMEKIEELNASKSSIKASIKKKHSLKTQTDDNSEENISTKRIKWRKNV